MDGLAFYDYYTEELEHHGILGQKWGHLNGPPYPLDSEDHSAAEKKAGWRKSLESTASNVSTAVKKKAEEIKVKRAEKSAQKAEAKRIKEEEEAAAAEQKKLTDKATAIRSGDPSLVAQYASEMTIQEYREAVDRLNLANQVNKYLPPEEAKLTLAQRVTNFTNKVDEKVSAYNNVARLTNLFFKTDLPILDKSALDRAEERAKKASKKQEEEEKKVIDAYQNRVKLMTANKQLQDLEEYEANRETAKEVKRWQDQAKVASSKSQIRKFEDDLKTKDETEAKKKMEKDEELAYVENRVFDERKLRQDWNDAIMEEGRRQYEALKGRQAEKAETDRATQYRDTLSALGEEREAQVKRATDSANMYTYVGRVEALANSPDISDVKLGSIESSGYVPQTTARGLRSYDQALEDWARESG